MTEFESTCALTDNIVAIVKQRTELLDFIREVADNCGCEEHSYKAAKILKKFKNF